jgi:predicted nucleotidyltransferase
MTAREEPHIETADLDAIRAALDGTDVVFALLFGSHARSEATGDSDLDIAVRFPDRLSDRDRFRARNRIDATLQAHAEGTVDVNDIDALPVAVQHAALREGSCCVATMTRLQSTASRSVTRTNQRLTSEPPSGRRSSTGSRGAIPDGRRGSRRRQTPTDQRVPHHRVT